MPAIAQSGWPYRHKIQKQTRNATWAFGKCHQKAIRMGAEQSVQNKADLDFVFQAPMPKARADTLVCIEMELSVPVHFRVSTGQVSPFATRKVYLHVTGPGDNVYLSAQPLAHPAAHKIRWAPQVALHESLASVGTVVIEATQTYVAVFFLDNPDRLEMGLIGTYLQRSLYYRHLLDMELNMKHNVLYVAGSDLRVYNWV